MKGCCHILSLKTRKVIQGQVSWKDVCWPLFYSFSTQEPAVMWLISRGHQVCQPLGTSRVLFSVNKSFGVYAPKHSSAIHRRRGEWQRWLFESDENTREGGKLSLRVLQAVSQGDPSWKAWHPGGDAGLSLKLSRIPSCQHKNSSPSQCPLLFISYWNAFPKYTLHWKIPASVWF